MFITDIHSPRRRRRSRAPQFTDAWYWNFDAKNRPGPTSSWRRPAPGPSFAHAANYSAALQYLEAVQRAGTDDADAVVKELEGKKLNDVFLRNGEVRAADHRVLHDAYLAKVKAKDRGQGGVGLREDRQDHPRGRGLQPAVSTDCKL